MKFNSNKTRELILRASYEAGACHIGSALSCVEIVESIYEQKKDRDVFLFSKASGAATLYAVLAQLGKFPTKKIAEYLKNYPLASKEVPGVIHSVGSLGQGLSVAVGLAYADRTRKVYCLISDGELEEGNTYEAILSLRRLRLKNLIVYVDYNHIGACKRINMDFERMFPELHFVHTIKGQGIDFMEDSIAWHYRNLNEESLKKALKQLCYIH